MAGVSEQVEAELVRELGVLWAHYNRELFGKRLQPCTLAVEVMQPLGQWRSRERRILLSWRLILQRPWLSVIEVLKHEMAHQFVDEVLKVADETAHGPAFRAVCRERGIDARAAGEVVTEDPGGVAGRIRKLLALSESPNAHEAEAAMSAAMRLLRRHGLELKDVSEEEPGYSIRQIGAVRTRVPKHEQVLAGVLTEHFGVRGIWIPAWDPIHDVRGRVLEIAGTEQAVELAAYIHAVVLASAEREWTAYRRKAGIRSDRDRRRFLEGVVMGVRTAMKATETSLRAEGLILAADAGLDAWMEARHPRVVRRTVRVQLDPAHAAGRAAGEGLKLRPALKDRPASAGRQITSHG